MTLTHAALLTLVTWESRDRPDLPAHKGAYPIIAKDIGATVGIAVYDETGTHRIHTFYAHTRYVSAAREITRDLIRDAVDEIRADKGARNVVAEFPHRFPAFVYEHGHNDLDPSHMEDLT